nr:unnamed protein product [Digitaria exilis]
MKCHSVAALWSPSPPSHHVTAAAATPAALFTGAADGTVLHWPLASASASPSPRPSSILCAHAAAITALCPLPSPASLLAACAAGVLSLFSASAPLRCLRRRSLPPWAGSPSLITPLPSTASSNPRVAILCHAPDDGGGHRQVSALVVVDARTLAVLHTAFHGTLSVATPRAIAVGSIADEAISVVLADAQGRAQVVPVAEGAVVEGDSPRRLSISSVSSVASAETADGRVEAVALSCDGKVVALMLKTRCLLKCVVEGAVLGELSLLGTSLCKADRAEETGCTVGGFFLSGEEWNARASDGGIVARSLVLWSTSGAAAVYRVLVGTSSFEFEPVCEIPDNWSMKGGGSEVKFCQPDQRLVRVECCSYKLWKSSAEFCAMRSLSIVSLAQRMITLSRSCTNASSALAAFYTRHFAEKVPDIKPPSLQKKAKELDDADNLKLLLHNLDLSYRLHWVGGKTIKLTRHGQELGTFQL